MRYTSASVAAVTTDVTVVVGSRRVSNNYDTLFPNITSNDQ
jgi:hypothetical protein